MLYLTNNRYINIKNDNPRINQTKQKVLNSKKDKKSTSVKSTSDQNNKNKPNSNSNSKPNPNSINEGIVYKSEDSYYDLRNDWYQFPNFSGNNIYSEELTPLSLDSACTNKLTINSNISLEKNIEKQLFIKANQKYPDNVFFRELTQFWQLDDLYYQLTAVWERDMPAVYRIEFYSSTNKYFEQDVNTVPFEGQRANVDAMTVEEIVEKILQEYKAKGAIEGARIIQLNLPSADGKGEHELTYRNGKNMSWYFPQGECRLDKSGNMSLCLCDLDKEDNH